MIWETLLYNKIIEPWEEWADENELGYSESQPKKFRGTYKLNYTEDSGYNIFSAELYDVGFKIILVDPFSGFGEDDGGETTETLFLGVDGNGLDDFEVFQQYLSERDEKYLMMQYKGIWEGMEEQTRERGFGEDKADDWADNILRQLKNHSQEIIDMLEEYRLEREEEENEDE